MSQADTQGSTIRAELTKEQKLAAMTFIKETTDQLTFYLTGAIRLAHRNAEGGGIDPALFWKGLFIKQGTHWDRDSRTYLNDKPILTKGRDMSDETVPADPYKALDFQACCKYLLFGGDRILSGEGNEPQYVQDSLLVLRYFGVKVKEKRPGEISGPVGDDRQSLSRGIIIRNKSSHLNQISYESEDLKSLTGYLGELEIMTDCLFGNRKGWEAEAGVETTLSSYWEKRNRDFQSSFGVLPIPVLELAQELFASEEPSWEQMDALREAARELGVRLENDAIRGEGDRERLKEKLSQTPPLNRWFKGSGQAAGAIPPWENYFPLPTAKQTLWKPVVAAEAAELRKTGQSRVEFRQVAGNLLRSFELLVDESVFLSADGRIMLGTLTEYLIREKKKLKLDKSVVNSLFSQLRGSSRSYTQLERAALEAEGVDTAELEAENQKRHKSAKDGLKVLRALRERGLLTVMASPTEKAGSYWNLYRVVEMLPQARFLVITMNGDLAERLAEVGGRNAVAAKVNLFGDTLFLYQSTRSVYDRMLGITNGEEPCSLVPPQSTPSGQTPPALWPVRRSARQSPPSGGNAELPGEGQRLTARQADGVSYELVLGKSLGEGGEGRIHTLRDRPDEVAKLYFDYQRTEERQAKLDYMLTHRPGISGMCWPTAQLFTPDGVWVGYLMPRGRGKELALTVFHPGNRGRNLTEQGWTRRSLALTAANIAGIFDQMHRQGILMGDINPRNFLAGPDGSIYLVDCDSYQIGRFPCPVGTPLYTPPEVHRQMRQEHRDSYGYIRTPEHESYSLAVLLFEILMLGKPPYESTNGNNTDVVEAIMAGRFPYRVNRNGEEPQKRDDIQPPKGYWKNIWSHTSYEVKVAFDDTFSRGLRLTPEQWQKVMLNYARLIQEGKNSDEVCPTSFKEVAEGDVSQFVHLKCEQCGVEINIAQEVYQRRLARGEPILCTRDQGIRDSLKTRMTTVPCANPRCENQVVTSMLSVLKGQKLYCEDCRQEETVTCQKCCGSFKIYKGKAEEIRQRGGRFYCAKCRWAPEKKDASGKTER